MAFLLAIHLLAAVIWIGGMFFAYVCLRPAAASLLDPPLRLQLWERTFRAFFVWVWIIVTTIVLTGHGMISIYGGITHIGKHVLVMMGVGYTMIFIFTYLYFVPFKRLKLAVTANDWPRAGEHLNVIRKIVAINLSLGLFTIVIASSGRYLVFP